LTWIKPEINTGYTGIKPKINWPYPGIKTVYTGIKPLIRALSGSKLRIHN